MWAIVTFQSSLWQTTWRGIDRQFLTFCISCFPHICRAPIIILTTILPSNKNKFEEGAVLNTDCLIICKKYKYKTLLDKGEWDAPTTQEEHIIALRAEINTLKARSSKGGAGKRQHQCHAKPSTGKHTQKKRNEKFKRYFSWQLILQKIRKTIPELSGKNSTTGAQPKQEPQVRVATAG